MYMVDKDRERILLAGRKGKQQGPECLLRLLSVHALLLEMIQNDP